MTATWASSQGKVPFAFARHWFKINLTTDRAGRIVETGDEHNGRFAFNCDAATPMRRRGGAVYVVDLFVDVLADRTVSLLAAAQSGHQRGLAPEEDAPARALIESFDRRHG